MVKKGEDCLKLTDEVRESQFSDFTEWFSEIILQVRPSVIVAIARGALRFLQLHYHSSLPSNIRILCHHAIPFLQDHELLGARFLVFDDSIVHGSTMDSVKSYLESRGATVFCTAYAIDRKSFLGETESPSSAIVTPSVFSRIPVITKHKLWHREMRRHHAGLVQSILRTALHYNLDFPTFCLRVPNLSKYDSPYIVHLLRTSNVFRRIESISCNYAAAKGVFRYTGLLWGNRWRNLSLSGASFRPYGKMRITILPETGEVRVTPVIQLSLSDSVNHDEIEFRHKRLATAWRTLLFPHANTDRFYHQSLFRLLTAFMGTVIGSTVCIGIKKALEKGLSVKSCEIIPDDMTVILGNENSEALCKLWNGLQKEPIPVGDIYGDTGTPLRSEAPNAPELRQKLVVFFRLHPELQPFAGESEYDSIGKVLLGVHAVTDSDEIRRKDPRATRLENGLSFEGINHLLAEVTGKTLNRDELSLAIDTCIDQGIAVPKIVKENGEWFRVFYSGENRHAHAPLQLDGALNEAYKNFISKPRVQPLSLFEFQKLAVAIKDVVGWVPLSILPFRYGFSTTVGHEQLIKRLTDGPAAPFRKVLRNGSQLLLPVTGYVCPVDRTWEPQEVRDFFDAFDYTATAIGNLPAKSKADALLLLSSCRTHRHTHNAVAFEAHTWATYEVGSFSGDEHYVFGRFLVSIDSQAHRKLISAEFLTSLYWWIRYVSEAMKKYRIFYTDYERNLASLKNAFYKQGAMGKRWWNFLEGKKLFDPTIDPDIADRFSLLVPLIGQMKRLTIFVVKTLFDSKLLSEQYLEVEFRRHGASMQFSEFDWLRDARRVIAANEYNKEISNGQLPGRSIFKNLLPVMSEPNKKEEMATWCETNLSAAKKCFLEISEALGEFCKKYDVNEGDFPFSPRATRKMLTDGSAEIRRTDVFLLTMDIIKGTNAEQTNRMKDAIREVLRARKDAGLIFGDTGDDAFVACADDPKILWDAANVIRVRGQDLIIPGEAFGGTRKGIYYGTVAVIEKEGGETLIRDVRIPNVIPPAMYMLKGIDEHCKKNEQNSMLIIDERISFKQFVAMLNLNGESMSQIIVKETKHFPGGPCRLAKLG